ncbi:GNAT family N-acetyltransferase [Scleromatobacter humisilvae]|uniref:GNAT family N-acetyltransferase n=1 Tax=Scleromatobacter humisilvae TaxID=2897159 RepID=A0A9X2BZH9_9BURK|nr:GNAT family N-acetyltransferase [Scleromatobacter humisilvae]MCK9686357.1 GNAT family N-acetyltransferase [Scleromatobacter humisilvae]
MSKQEALAFVGANAALLDSKTNPPNPFASSEWVHHFIDQVADEDWRIVALEGMADSGNLMLAWHHVATPWRFTSLTNYYASLYSPLASLAGSSEERAAAMRSVVQQLRSVRPRVATLQLAPLDGQSPDTVALLHELRHQGWHARQYFAFGNWTLPCEGLAFDAYIAARDSQVRNTLARKSKKLLAAGSLEILTEEADVDRGMDAWDAIYSRSWKQREPYPDFVRGWARRCARRGWLRLGIASLEGKPIAAQFWFTIDRRAYIFKLAYDEEYSKWSAGTVLTAHMFRHALEADRVVEIDYLTGDDPYKSAWMSDRRERIGVLACNPRSPRGAWAAAREMAGSLSAPLRQRLREVARPQA